MCNRTVLASPLRVGSVPGSDKIPCLQGADIGIAYNSMKRPVYISWGRNIPIEQTPDSERIAVFESVSIHNHCEVVLTDAESRWCLALLREGTQQ